MELVDPNQGYTGEHSAKVAETHGISPKVVKHSQVKQGFVLLSHRRVVERDFASEGLCPASRFRRLTMDYKRLPGTLEELHFVAFACLFLQQEVGILDASS